LTTELIPIKARGIAVRDRGVFTAHCPTCQLENSVEFNKKMLRVELHGCNHFINHHLKPGDGVYFNFFQE
jgi:hypothetical protein